MKNSFTSQEVDQIENNSYEVGIIVGRSTERARIIELLQSEKNADSLIALIKGEKK
jgi:hypothetical protein